MDSSASSGQKRFADTEFEPGNSSKQTPHQQSDSEKVTFKQPKIATCEICDKTFKRKSSLKRHKLMHTGYQCRICKKQLASSVELCEHLKEHKGENPFLIGKLAKNQISQPDVITYSRNKTHKCNLCGKAFIFLPVLQYHMTKHGVRESSNSEQGGKTLSEQTNPVQCTAYTLLNCNVCMKFFIFESDLRNHLCTPHFTCAHCNETYLDKQLLNDHMSKHFDETVCVVDSGDQTHEEGNIHGKRERGFSEPILSNQLVLEQPVVQDDTGAQLETFVVDIAEPLPDGNHVNTHVVKNGTDTSKHPISKINLQMGRVSQPVLLSQSQTKINGDCLTLGDDTSIPIQTVEFSEVPTLPENTGQNAGSKELQSRPKNKAFVCQYCGRGFPKPSTLRQHVRLHTGENPFKCDKCGKLYSDLYALRRHLKIHTGLRPHQCETCGKQFAVRYNLTVHMNTHLEDKLFKCGLCEKAFTVKNSLKTHMLIKHSNLNVTANIRRDSKPHQCDVCGRLLKTKVTLMWHMRTHTGEKPYKCDMCDRTFSMKNSLNIHRRTHTGEKPYQCAVCGKGFGDMSSARQHTNVHLPMSDKQKFVCDTCGKCVMDRSSLSRHLKTHSGEKPFTCEFCGKGFLQGGQLRIHRYTHTGEKPFACEICSKAFADRSTLHRHLKRHES